MDGWTTNFAFVKYSYLQSTFCCSCHIQNNWLPHAWSLSKDSELFALVWKDQMDMEILKDKEQFDTRLVFWRIL